MFLVLDFTVFDDLTKAAREPVVLKRLVVFLFHELVDMNEVHSTIGPVRQRNIRGDKGVIQGGQPLLTIENDVLWFA